MTWSKRLGLARWWGLAAAGVIAWSCGGSAVGRPTTGGESHFLTYCESSCGGGFDCIGGVCTRGCLVAESTCSAIAADAVCTDQSGEPGAVAVCDVGCKTDRDCSGVGEQHRCEDGFCRAPTPTGGSGGATGTGNGPGVGGGPGQSCEIVHQTIASGTTGVPIYRSSNDGLQCMSCDCHDGQTSCTTVECGAGLPIRPCAAEWSTDTVQVHRHRLGGDLLSLDVGVSGGCVPTKDFALCYNPYFRETDPVQTDLYLLHDGHGDACEAYMFETLAFDLSDLGETYKRSYQADHGVISTDFGEYAFGELSCEERINRATEQARQATEQLDLACLRDEDCVQVQRIPSCGLGCWPNATRSVVNGVETGSAQHYEALVAAIDEGLCRDVEADGCDIPNQDACGAPPARCLNGICVAEQ